MQQEYPVGVWKKLKVIGRGGSSTVYKCVLKDSGSYLAVKEIITDGMSSEQIKGIGGEVDTIKNLSHDNIVRCFGSQQVDNHLYIMLEYCGHGSLRKLYQDRGALSEPEAARCVTQILRGLEYLHTNGVAHRDVKGANILLTDDGILKLADFGASKKMEMESLVSGLKGTPHWMAPEVIKGTQMSTGWMKADVWSLGCTLVEVLSASLPFSEYENPMTAMYQIAGGKVPPLPPTASAEASSFVQDCCAADPDARPSVTTLLQHPFLLKSGSLGSEQEFSYESQLFESAPASKLILTATEGSTDIASSEVNLSPDLEMQCVEESYVDDDMENVLSTDVNRFIEQRKEIAPAPIDRLSVRTTSFRYADTDSVPSAPLECEDTPVLYRSRKSIHTMSSHNVLKSSDCQSTATTPAMGAVRRPPLQVSTDASRISMSMASSGIAHRGTDFDDADPDDIMEAVISPRLTSLKVSLTVSTPKVSGGINKQSSPAGSLTGDNVLVSGSHTGGTDIVAQNEIGFPEGQAVAMITRGPAHSALFSQDQEAISTDPISAPSQALKEEHVFNSGHIMFKMGRTDSDRSTSGVNSGKNHTAPAKRKHRNGRKFTHPSADYQSPQKQQLKLGTIKIGVSHNQDNSQTPTTKTSVNFEHSTQGEASPTLINGNGPDKGSSTDIVFTPSGAQKRKLKPTPPGVSNGAPLKVSASSRRNFVSPPASVLRGPGSSVPHCSIDLVKSCALPPIGVNPHAGGLTGKKRDKNEPNKCKGDNVEIVLRPSAPLSADKLQYSGEIYPPYGEEIIAHGSSTSSTTISEACAIASESNFGKFGPPLLGQSGNKELGINRAHQRNRQNVLQNGVAVTERQVRHVNIPKARLASLAKSNARSHSAGVVSEGLPPSNNMSSSSRPQLPVIRQKITLQSDSGNNVLRSIQTAPAPSRLPPIVSGSSGEIVGSVTPSSKMLNNAST